MKYDDASWHYGGDFPADLPSRAGAIHIAMFVVWAWSEGLASAELAIAATTPDRSTCTPTSWFLEACEEKFIAEDLTDEGNAFARAYYANAEGGLRAGEGSYLADYSDTFPEVEDLYFVLDSWKSYDRIAPVVSARLAAWRALG